MKKKLLIIPGVLLALWCGIFIIDYVRCSTLQAPIFVVVEGATLDDGGSGTFQGLGYRVKVKKSLDLECGVKVESVEMSMFGKVIAASISDDE